MILSSMRKKDIQVLGYIGVEKVAILSLTKCSVKGIVHPKMKILSLITHPHVVPNP